MNGIIKWMTGGGRTDCYLQHRKHIEIDFDIKILFCLAVQPSVVTSFIVYAQRILVYCMIGSLRYRWFGYWIWLRPQRSSRQDMDLDDYADFWASVDNQTSDGCWYHWRRSVPCSCVCSMLLRLWKSAIDGARWCPSTRIRILHSFMIHFYNRTLIMTCSVHNKFMVEYIYIYT